MSIIVRIPSPLRRFTDSQATVEVSAKTVQDALSAVILKYQDLRFHLYGDDGELRNFVNVYVGENDIRQLKGMDTPLTDGDEVLIIPSIAGGKENGPIFEREEYLRYSRHFSLPEIGLEGQKKLKQASVLVVGVGGLGCPVAIYLAAAGVGRIGLVDFDVVDLSNLQRQILYSSKDVGKPKLRIARERLEGINPKVQVAAHEEPFSSVNAVQILAGYDLVIDGTDNFPTRYLVNDVSVFQGKPNVYGSIFRFEGQVSIFHAKEGPCYRCLYATPPPPGLVPSCAEGGVLGVLPGIVGSLQAAEAIKWITGIGDPLIGRLLLFDALSMTFREVRLEKNDDCVVCGKNPTIVEPIDYEGFCGVSGTAETVNVPEIDVHEVKQKLDRGDDVTILDVREQWEWQIAHLDEAHFIPMNSIPSRLDELSPSGEIVVHCHSGKRSASITEYLIKQGYTDVKSMAGGIRAWTIEVDPSLNLY
ncbi:MAG: molybdopterin-synthase adenylyltransferase MoeB [Candidatus Marinimicrobia bacterium]|nr:molybdopterin-synthase adenylyltransferase MoeB [Candidatus Neomarinimicrobiota bacterium]